MDEDRIKARLHAKRQELQKKGLLPQLVLAGLGVLLVLAGLLMLVLPGPAFIVLPLGFALLSVRFAWAARLMDLSIERTAAASRMSRQRKIIAMVIAGGAALLALGAFLLLRG